ncbi:alkaline phosphatase PhoX [Phenylobacterium deserti]|uniref:Phosphatase n=1 Tax=Phenylobacterium deserti TaxID=1914756 RepID=A0A328AFF1_9CAUL|nr:alkaline phosphatase PhoX [Phenylobacterium deserti]RAK51528.1 phosphatase [Phenylobacterium deserti]
MSASRRTVLASAAGLAFLGASRIANADAGLPPTPYKSEVFGYGPLRPDPAGLFDLPEGFSYKIVSRFGEPMSDGFTTPGKMDGMYAFPGGGDLVRLVRNHELNPADIPISAYGADGALASRLGADRPYDRLLDGKPAPGGTTTVVWDLRAQRMVSSHVSLAGTSTNCAGGHTPWGSWLTCEETVEVGGRRTQKAHGWVFEVPAGLNTPADPTPITGMGRFRHEAVAIDPRTGIAYLTEDEGDGRGLFYRFLPNDRRKPQSGGRLQALGFAEGADADPRNWTGRYLDPGQSRPVRWIDVDGVDNPDNDLRDRGHAAGAAWFARGEGVFWGDGELFFTCTSGGPEKYGQIFRYRPSAHEGQAGERDAPGQIQLFVEPRDADLMRMCDNIAVAPWGHLIVCEDKDKGSVNFLKAVTPEGKIYTIGRNAHPGDGDVGGNSELAGCCFSPDGTTLFVNVYRPGMTLAIRGPWSRFRA